MKMTRVEGTNDYLLSIDPHDIPDVSPSHSDTLDEEVDFEFLEELSRTLPSPDIDMDVRFEHEGKRYIVCQSFCPRSHCSCTEFRIGIYRETVPEPTPIDPPLHSWTYDYDSHVVNHEDGSAVRAEAAILLDALLATKPDLLTQMEAYARWSHKFQTAIVERPRRIKPGTRPTSPQGRRSPSGRHRCPCGSGYRYKSCCAKSQRLL